ncbi:zinc finger, CCHC-type containing protein, partial [Tanacetum coccineum]
IIHETTAPYTPQQNGVAERKNRALKKIVNSMLSYSGLSEGFWGEAMAVVRLPDLKRKTLGEKGIDCIFVGYADHSKAYRDDHSDDVPSEIPEPRKGKRVRKAKSYGSDFQLYLVEGSRDHVGSQYSYCYSIEEDPITYDEAMQSRDAAFWKEAIDDEIGSIMENNTWVLSDLPPGCKPLGCKWIFKRKMKVDGTIDKFKARLVIQGFRQKEGIDYFDTYAPIARITTIRLLLALAVIHNLVIHQMDVKTTFLNGDLDEEVYMKQPEGFVMSGNGHKYVYSKFDDFGKGVIICLYVDDMLIFGTDQNQVDKTKKFLSSRFLMKDIGEIDVILGIKIKHENKGIVITQSYYIEKILKKFNCKDCSPVNTPMDPVEKLKPNTGKPVDQLEYSRAIGCLMYAMTSIRLDIAYVVGRLKAYSDASWINHVEDSSSTSGWVFLLEGGAISWDSKKQTCIIGSTMESEFVALAAA